MADRGRRPGYMLYKLNAERSMSVLQTLRSAKVFVLNKARNVKYKYQDPEVRFVSSGRYLLEQGESEVHELPDLIEPDTNVIDVGANCGAYAYAICRLIDNGHVYCIEPLDDLAEIIKKASVRLNLPITVLTCGLSSERGRKELYVPYENGRRIHACASLNPTKKAGEKHEIELRKLDDITAGLEKKVSLIKIDVEGHELEVLKGGINTLKVHRPNLLIEIEERHSRVPISMTFNFLLDQGYRGFFLNSDGERTPLDQFDPVLHQNTENDLFSPEYVNNFIFVPCRM